MFHLKISIMDLQTKNNVVATLQNLLKDCSEAFAVVIDSYVVNNDWTIRIEPTGSLNTGTFVHANEVVDVCRTFKVYNWMCVEQKKGMAFVAVYIH